MLTEDLRRNLFGRWSCVGGWNYRKEIVVRINAIPNISRKLDRLDPDNHCVT